MRQQTDYEFFYHQQTNFHQSGLAYLYNLINLFCVTLCYCLIDILIERFANLKMAIVHSSATSVLLAVRLRGWHYTTDTSCNIYLYSCSYSVGTNIRKYIT